MNEDVGARQSLDDISAARQVLLKADKKLSWSHGLLYGAACGLLVAGQGLQVPWSIGAPFLSIAAFGWLYFQARRLNGWSVSGYSPRKARWVAIAMVVALFTLMGISIWGKHAGIAWMPLATGAAGFLIALIGAHRWMQVWETELREPGA